MAKTKTVTTPAPSGLTITRKGRKFTCTWSTHSYRDQQVEYKIYGVLYKRIGSHLTHLLFQPPWQPLDVGKNTNKKSITIDTFEFQDTSFKRGAPTKIGFRVKGLGQKQKGKTVEWSDWKYSYFDIKEPKKPALSAALNNDVQTTFSFDFQECTDTSKYILTKYQWESILVRNCSSTKGSSQDWSHPQKNGEGTSFANSVPIKETGWSTPGYSYTRWFRIRGIGPEGASDYSYARHVYAKPFAATNVKAVAIKKAGSGYTVSANWTTNSTVAHPIDEGDGVKVQYWITEPVTSIAKVGNRMVTSISCPLGESWTDAGNGGPNFVAKNITIGNNLEENNAIFVRVLTKHDFDNDAVESARVFAANGLGKLSDPSSLNPHDIDVDERRVTVSVTNNCNLAASFIALYFRTTSQTSSDRIIGIVPHGENEVTIQLPEWPEGENFSIGAQAVLGDYSPVQPSSDDVTEYSVIKHTSSDIVWSEGVPLPPAGVTIDKKDNSSVQISWKWSWAEADGAELSWSQNEFSWESTDEPTTYNVTNTHASSWIISGLSTGQWYFRVRLFKTVGDTTIYGTYSGTKDFKLSVSPATPSLTVQPGVITKTGTVTCTWAYVSGDGTAQSEAVIKDADTDNILATATTTQYATISAEEAGWQPGETHNLTLLVKSGSGEESAAWSNPVPVRVAEEVTSTITSTSLETLDMPVDSDIAEETISGDPAIIQNDSEYRVISSLKTDITPIQDLHGYDKPWVGGSGKNLAYLSPANTGTIINSGVSYKFEQDGSVTLNGTASASFYPTLWSPYNKSVQNAVAWSGYANARDLTEGNYYWSKTISGTASIEPPLNLGVYTSSVEYINRPAPYAIAVSAETRISHISLYVASGTTFTNYNIKFQLESGSTATSWTPYSNICPISGRDEVVTSVVGKNLSSYNERPVAGPLWGSEVSELVNVINTLPVGTYTISNKYRIEELPSTNSVAHGGLYVMAMIDGKQEAVNSYSIATDTSPSVGKVYSESKPLVITEQNQGRINHCYCYCDSAEGHTGTERGKYKLYDIQLELGSTATDYEPYLGTTYTTPVHSTPIDELTDKVPYLSKIAGLPSNVRQEVDKLVGGTVAWNQFAKQVAGLVQPVDSTRAFDDSTKVWTCTATNMQSTSIGFYTAPAYRLKNGHKTLISVNVNPSNDMAFRLGRDGAFKGFTTVANKYNNLAVITDSTADNIAATFYATGVKAQGLESFSFTMKDFIMIDLTQMFGTTIADYIYGLEQTTAGAGVAFFKKLFPNDYYEYNAGELLSVKTSEHRVYGKNLLDLSAFNLDAQWVDVDGVVTNSDYPLTGNYKGCGINGKKVATLLEGTYTLSLRARLVSGTYTDGTFNAFRLHTNGANTKDFRKVSNPTLSSNFQTYYGVLTIEAPFTFEDINLQFGTGMSNAVFEIKEVQLELGTTATDYEPYSPTVYPLSDIELRGTPKLDSDNNLYYDGDTYEGDGTVTRKYGVVDLGTLNWTYYNNRFDTTLSDVKGVVGWNQVGLICSSLGIAGIQPNETANDKCLGLYNKALYCRYNSITDTTSFKSAMSGVYLIYELATPTTETALAYTNPQPIQNGQIESYTDSRSVPMPVGHETVYQSTAVYGGTLDVVSGELVVDRVMTTMDGSADERWSLWGNAFVFQGTLSPSIKKSDVVDTTNMIVKADRFVSKGVNYRGTQGTNGIIKVVGNNSYIAVDPSSYTDVEEFESSLASNPMQLCYELATPQTYQLTPTEVNLLLGTNNISADTGKVDVTVKSETISELSLTHFPLTVSAMGAGSGGNTTIIVERAQDFFLDRPDESEFNGFEDETIVHKTVIGEGTIEINQTDLLGAEALTDTTMSKPQAYLDDTAKYRLTAIAQDTYGQYKESDPIEFTVHWNHQAVMPTAMVAADNDQHITYIKPIQPEEGYEEGDRCDIYRLSADRPELIMRDAEFGKVYVDPYPTLGDLGGHRIVYKTYNGDYKAGSEFAWTDYRADDPDTDAYWHNFFAIIIDFDGYQLVLPYDVSVSQSWAKDFTETKYLGGSVRGDWNPATSRTASLTSTIPVQVDPENIELLRRLASYPGACHVRTPDGSSYAANVEVKEDREEKKINMIAKVNLEITRVEAEGFDCMTYEQWIGEE